jgi:hypothetical protein
MNVLSGVLKLILPGGTMDATRQVIEDLNKQLALLNRIISRMEQETRRPDDRSWKTATERRCAIERQLNHVRLTGRER